MPAEMHSFDTEIAADVGVVAATIYANIRFWVIKNAQNQSKFHDGLYWTYNSRAAFKRQFHYLSEKQIRTALDKLEERGYIRTSNYNQKGFDRTKWYAITHDLPFDNEGNWIGQKGPTDWPEKANGGAQKGQPIPDCNSDSVPDGKEAPQPPNGDKGEKRKSKPQYRPEDDKPDGVDDQVWADFCQHRKDMKKPLTEIAVKRMKNQLERMRREGQDINEAFNQSMINGWQGIFDVKGRKSAQQPADPGAPPKPKPFPFEQVNR